ncbi:hypothetical protein ACFL3C_04490 [Patescibacteria group bacterium]
MPKKAQKKKVKKPAAKRKTRMSRLDKKMWRVGIWITVAVAIIIFAVFMFILRSTIRDISKDPSLTSISSNSAFNVVMLINKNKNIFAENKDDCWNQKHTYASCNESNKLVEGKYALRGSEDRKWLEGPYDEKIESMSFEIPHHNVREALGGFMKTEMKYYQTINISYPDDEEKMNVEILTMNDKGDKHSETITIKK